ncbi:MAG TPA: hypothetical protein VKV28_04510 [Candidatus Binataceae bacterium]|nr:hypothetical protein [Candidatus Binataceae bacterium]
MATFRRNRSGHWEAAVRRRNHRPQYATCDTKADAEAWAASIEGDMARGRFVSGAEAEKTSLAEALDRYEREVSAKKRGYPRSGIGLHGSDAIRWRSARWRRFAPRTLRTTLASASGSGSRPKPSGPSILTGIDARESVDKSAEERKADELFPNWATLVMISRLRYSRKSSRSRETCRIMPV